MLFLFSSAAFLFFRGDCKDATSKYLSIASSHRNFLFCGVHGSRGGIQLARCAPEVSQLLASSPTNYSQALTEEAFTKTRTFLHGLVETAYVELDDKVIEAKEHEDRSQRMGQAPLRPALSANGLCFLACLCFLTSQSIG